ncbi:MAG TPA: hypothetical protein VMU20_07920 [Candidatus Dormibacteraeota bacterium]|nr:hypothetical protein [Candidatus Dormibacteraeota bacterium]
MGQSARFDVQQLLGRLSRGEQVIGIASVVLLLSLFLSWLSFSCSGPFCGAAGAGAGGFHGWGWLTFLALLGVAALLVIRCFLAETLTLPELPAPDAAIYMAGGVLEVVGCLLFWVEYHDSFQSIGAGPTRFSYGLGFGWWMALLAGVSTVIGGLLMQREREATHAERHSPPPTPATPPAR